MNTPVYTEGDNKAGFAMRIHSSGRTLLLRIYGPWTEEIATVYQARWRSMWEHLPKKGWGVFVDMRDSPRQIAKVIEMRGQMVKEAVEHGMRRVAYVIKDASLHRQIRAMARTAGCEEAECFTDDSAAFAWLLRP